MSRSSNFQPSIHTCVRVYVSGDRATERFPSWDEVEKWVQSNRTLRFGCALFVDGVCVERGYLCADHCKALESDLCPAPAAALERAA